VTSINFESRCCLDKSVASPPELHQELDHNENFTSPEEVNTILARIFLKLTMF